MTAQILDGKHVARKIQEKLKQDIEKIAATTRAPGLAVIQVGDNPASSFYIKNKRAACHRVGIDSHMHHLPENTSRKDLDELIQQLNQAEHIDGILLQLPLPEHLDAQHFIESIAAEKDVDGFHPYNIGRLMLREPALRPCTPYGVIQLLQYYDIPLPGKNAVIVGASNIVGRPMALELLLAKCTVTICHRFTKNLQQHINAADILISATGLYNVFDANQIAEGAIVVDVGFGRDKEGRIHGDVDFHAAAQRASWITPVPGGVGPMTVTTLLSNTVQAFRVKKP